MTAEGSVELVEFGALSVRQWIELTGREPAPFGAASAELEWRPKQRHVGLRLDGRLVAVAGATVATVSVEGSGSFDVVGLGGLIITPSARGQGLMVTLMDGLARLAEGLGPDRAVIFCRDGLVALYARRGYAAITAPVWVDQPGGRIEVPLHTMWRPLRGAPGWPPGRVDVDGLPF